MEQAVDCFIDRFEGETAVLIARGQEILMPVSLLPEGAVAGDHLSLSFQIDPRMKKDVTDEISRLQQRLAHPDTEPMPESNEDS